MFQILSLIVFVVYVVSTSSGQGVEFRDIQATFDSDLREFILSRKYAHDYGTLKHPRSSVAVKLPGNAIGMVNVVTSRIEVDGVFVNLVKNWEEISSDHASWLVPMDSVATFRANVTATLAGFVPEVRQIEGEIRCKITLIVTHHRSFDGEVNAGLLFNEAKMYKQVRLSLIDGQNVGVLPALWWRRIEHQWPTFHGLEMSNHVLRDILEATEFDWHKMKALYKKVQDDD